MQSGEQKPEALRRSITSLSNIANLKPRSFPTENFAIAAPLLGHPGRLPGQAETKHAEKNKRTVRMRYCCFMSVFVVACSGITASRPLSMSRSLIPFSGA
jgi:hypothetical protein